MFNHWLSMEEDIATNFHSVIVHYIGFQVNTSKSKNLAVKQKLYNHTQSTQQPLQRSKSQSTLEALLIDIENAIMNASVKFMAY